MNASFSENLLLKNETGKHFFFDYAKDMPIIDYHCHLSPKEIYENREFTDIGEMWLAGDHYKWRAMRVLGVDEKYITGDASYHDKFLALARIMPKLAGNPIYIWCALELKRYFGIDEALCAENAEQIYRETTEIIRREHMCPRKCMEMSNVYLVSTTEDPVDDLKYHFAIRDEGTCRTRIISAFRPDNAMNCEKKGYGDYLQKLEAASGMQIASFRDLISALEKRLQLFREIGTTVSDAGVGVFHWRDASAEELDAILAKARSGGAVEPEEIDRFRSAFLLEMGRMYFRNGFVMQIHIGPLRCVNSVMTEQLGPDTGFDVADNPSDVRALLTLMDRLNSEGCLPKTILYPLNANDQEAYAIIAAAMCKGPVRGYVQLGTPWWFSDQVYGIRRQFEAVANLYPLSSMVGMLTDSRSFLSYTRHELYRRILCDYLGELVERGEYFSDEKEIKQMIEDICFNNAKEYFGF